MEVGRRKFQGVLNILSFNRHFYIYGLAVLAIILGSQWLIDWNAVLLSLVVAGFVYGLLMPLIVSAYVYDFSGFYHFDWLREMNLQDGANKLNLNINAGFDETSYIIKRILPESELLVFDFYNASQHTEPAIVRAREVSMVYPNTQVIDSSHIPLNDKQADNIFLVSSIHEMRSQEEKVQFLKECRRVCKQNGHVIVVEHLRDIPNFLAFTIGVTHFFSKATWKRAFDKAGFTSIQEKKFTPFMSIFNCK